ncbi:MAG TPA: nucleotidyltransferase family protein [Rectinemataceae bacterium]|nr:nucleotidyltransferase family protein [Rectinemataceae bacterium]
MNDETNREIAIPMLRFLGMESAQESERNARLRDFLDAAERTGWESVVRCARKAQLSPLLYHALRAVSPSTKAPPQSALDALRTDHLRSLCRNMRILHTVSEIVAECNAKNIPVILLKGAALATAVYKDPGLRPMGDVDILVGRQDIPEVHAILTRKGYRNLPDKDMMAANHVPPCISPGKPTIEIHFTILEEAQANSFNAGELFERAVPITLSGVGAMTLAPEDGLLHLCEHAGAHHVFEKGIRSMVDISRLSEKYRDCFAWEAVWARADEWGIRRSLALCLSLCKKYIGFVIPSYIQDWLSKQENVEQNLEAAESILFASDRRSVGSLAFAEFFSAKTLRAKARILFRVLSLPKETLLLIAECDQDKHKKKRTSLLSLYIRRASGLWKRHKRAALQALLKNSGRYNASQPFAASSDAVLSLREWLKKNS